jgi:hypothetical protein
MDAAAITRLMVGRVTEVVLHVVVALHLGGRERRLELAEDVLERLLHDVREEVDATAMRHADRDLLHPHACGTCDERLEHRDERGATLEREALLPRVARMQELLETIGEQQRARSTATRAGSASCGRLRVLSMRACSHSRCPGSGMSMNSAPSVPQ